LPVVVEPDTEVLTDNVKTITSNAVMLSLTVYTN